MSKSAADIFEAWSLYDRILDQNLMFHDEIFATVREILQERFGDRRFSVLDLGCGSARHVSSALNGLRVACFVGYDLSAAALERARDNLRELNCPVSLKLGDLLEGLRTAAEQPDLILSSFAVHHLSSEDKKGFFKDVAEKLADDGMLLLIDTAREEGEDRATYLDRYCRWLRTDWRDFSEEALDAIIDHIRCCDYPETVSTLRAMAADAGLGRCQEARRFGWHRTFCFEKDSDQ